jgi:hypothetical protein
MVQLAKPTSVLDVHSQVVVGLRALEVVYRDRTAFCATAAVEANTAAAQIIIQGCCISLLRVFSQ